MIIEQKKDGSGIIKFSDQEIGILQKHKQLEMSPEFMKHFANHLARIIFSLQDNFKGEIKSLLTKEDTKIVTKDK